MKNISLIENIEKLFLEKSDDELSKIYSEEKKYEKEKIIKNYNIYIEKNSLIENIIFSNIDNNDNLNLTNVFYKDEVNIFFYLTSILVVLTIFSTEYHTKFGEFVASLPYNKQTIYFSKVLVSILSLVTAYLVSSLVTIYIIKTSILSEIVSFSQGFIINYKILILSLIIMFFGIILSAFCGSFISILAMYIPVLTFVMYLL